MEEDVIEYEVHKKRDLEIEKRILSLLDAVYDEDHINWDKLCYYIPTKPMEEAITTREILHSIKKDELVSPQDLAYRIQFVEDSKFKKELTYWLAFYTIEGEKDAINT